MTRQMSAERTRRAVVTEAEGAKSAAITVAEGNKEAAILNAEGSKQSAILTAEGERQAAILRAEGFALALQTINESASVADAKTMQLQYLEALRALGDVAVVEGRRADGAVGPRGRVHGRGAAASANGIGTRSEAGLTDDPAVHGGASSGAPRAPGTPDRGAGV